jgi:hypothetical protein
MFDVLSQMTGERTDNEACTHAYVRSFEPRVVIVVVSYLEYVAEHSLRDAETFSAVYIVTEVYKVAPQEETCS